MLRQPAQKGQVIVAFALVMVGFMFTLIVATLDLQALAVAYNRADTAALLAAQAGSGGVCITQSAACPAGTTIYNASPGSPIYLDPGSVATRCATVAPAGNPPPGFKAFSLTCTISGSTVTAHVTFTPNYPLTALGFSPPSITLTRSGRPAFGCGNGNYTYTPLVPCA